MTTGLERHVTILLNHPPALSKDFCVTAENSLPFDSVIHHNPLHALLSRSTLIFGFIANSEPSA